MDGRLAGEAAAPSRPRGAGGPHRAQVQVGRGRLPSAGGRGHWALASPACPVPRPCREPVPSGGGITPREFAALAPALPGASEPFRQAPLSSSEGSALPGPARPCPAHPGTPTTSCGRPRRLALDLGGLWLPGTHALSARRDWTEKQPSTWLTQAWAPRLGSRKCGLSAGATSHPLCGPSWLGPPPQAQREGERRAGGPGWGGRGRQDPVLLHNSSLELMLKRSSCRKRTPGEFPLGTPRLSQEPPASVSGFPPSSWLPLLC